MKNLYDTDAGLQILYEKCVESGPFLCRMHENSPEKLHLRVMTLLEKLRLKPIAFYTKGIDDHRDTYGVVDYSIAKRTIFTSLYQPYHFWPNLFEALAELEKGNADPLWQMSGTDPMHDMVMGSCVCPAYPSDITGFSGWIATFAIACGDGPSPTDDFESLKKLYEDTAQISIFAEVWDMRLACS